MGGIDVYFIGYAKGVQGIDCFFDYRQVAVASHYDSDFFHIISSLSMNNEKWAHSILGFSSNEYAQTAGKVQGFGPCGAPLNIRQSQKPCMKFTY